MGGRTGASFLISNVFNIDIGPKATRKLHTGMHVVSDVFCKKCQTNIGWYYHEATSQDQQYKISHFVVECALICTAKQYELHNYHMPNTLMPNLSFDKQQNVPMSLPKYMSSDHRIFNNVHPENLRCDDEKDENDEDEDEVMEEEKGRICSKVRDKKRKRKNNDEQRQKTVTFADIENEQGDDDNVDDNEDEDEDEDETDQMDTHSLSETESEQDENEEELDID